jgi:hypothetical protein
MKISSRQFIKEAVTKPAFVESLKIKYEAEADPDFIIKTQNKNGEEIFSDSWDFHQDCDDISEIDFDN